MKKISVFLCLCISLLCISITAYADTLCDGVYTVHTQYTDSVAIQDTEDVLNFVEIFSDTGVYSVGRPQDSNLKTEESVVEQLQIAETPVECTYVSIDEFADMRDTKVLYYINGYTQEIEATDGTKIIKSGNSASYTGVLFQHLDVLKVCVVKKGSIQVENLKDAIEKQQNTFDKEMTGQVELNPVTESTKQRLAEIRLELEQRKANKSGYYNIVQGIQNVVATFLIIYAVVLVISYTIEVIGVGGDSVRPFTLVTFGKKWAVPPGFLESAVGTVSFGQNGVTLFKLIIWFIVLIVCSVFLYAVNLTQIGFMLYYIFK